MKRDGLSEMFFVAIVVSVLAHVGIMFYAGPRIMTQVAAGLARDGKRAPMRVTRDIPAPSPAAIDAIMDVDAPKDAPGAAPPAAYALEETAIEDGKTAAAPEFGKPFASVDLEPAEKPSFNIEPIVAGKPVPSVVVPAVRGIETPQAAVVPAAPAVPQDTVLRAPVIAASDIAGSAVFSSAGAGAVLKMERAPGNREDPDPGAVEEEIRAKVDEKVVEADKAAVRSLIDASEAEELKKFVNTAMVCERHGGWTYFRVMITARSDIPVIPKDVVLLIDASGSIGPSRMDSVRKAAKKILRSVTNSDDRFNLVAFRNRYTYAFRRWRECSRSSFDEADRWLDDLASHGRTDVFSTIRSVLTLPRTPSRPLIALVVTDGDANAGVSETSEILSRFTRLNDGLVSVYMYGVTSSANRELIDLLTRGNRGESLVFGGKLKWRSGSGMANLAGRFRDPVISDIRVMFSAATDARAYPRLLKNLYRGEVLEITGRVPAGTREIAFSLRGLNGSVPYEGFFKMPFAFAPEERGIAKAWHEEREIDLKLRKE